MKKSIKFRDYLAEQIKSGEKSVTWRLYDDKDLKVGDRVDFINWNTREKFGEADLLEVREKTLGTVNAEDYVGHEQYETEEERYNHYREYYGDEVGPDTPVKVIKFKFYPITV